MWCPARPDVKQQNLSVKMKMTRDGARARRCSQKASAKQSTIKCFAPQRRMSRTTKNNYREVCAYLASGDENRSNGGELCMKALRFSKFGLPSVLRIEEIPRPEPRDGEALVK